MLVLTRKSNQSIMIGDDIEVSVLSIMGEKVRIGIQAPRDIPVFRKEVYLEIQQERDAATVVAPRRDARSRRLRPTRSAAALAASAHHHVERLEHRDRHDDGRRDQQQHQQHEAQRAVLVLLLEPAACGCAIVVARVISSRRWRSASVCSRNASSNSRML